MAKRFQKLLKALFFCPAFKDDKSSLI